MYVGVVPQKETTSEGMAAILTHLHKYVRCITYTESRMYSNVETETAEEAEVHSFGWESTEQPELGIQLKQRSIHRLQKSN